MRGIMTQQNWMDALSVEIRRLQKNRSTLDNKDADKLIKDFISILSADSSTKQNDIILENITHLSYQIAYVKHKISIMSDNILKDEFIPEISVELNSVIEQTEKSVMGILDVLDEINIINQKITDPDIKEKLITNSTKIFELCNFQDLTGQIINRIIKRLTVIESTVDKIVEILGQSSKYSHNHNNNVCDILLHGPQKEAERPSQNQIDDLFSNLPEPKL